MVKVITINILFELEEWEQRRMLLVNGLASEQADLVALQEANLTENTGDWLAEQLGMPYVQTVPFQKLSPHGIPYGIAILSRHPFIQQETLDLKSQGRFAQFVEIAPANQSLVFCNGHYFWHPGTHPERDKQVQRLLGWLAKLPPKMPVIAVGDFNGTPETSAIKLMRQHFASAYATYNGREPDYTCPTPLARRNKRKFLRHIGRNLIVNHTLIPWQGTLDYIFFNQHLRVEDCRLILTKPASYSSSLYPSDHFGIVANLEVA
jgi:endonuclease/exonuclease/phosphatase family metal-dependent hydrolase